MESDGTKKMETKSIGGMNWGEGWNFEFIGWKLHGKSWNEMNNLKERKTIPAETLSFQNLPALSDMPRHRFELSALKIPLQAKLCWQKTPKNKSRRNVMNENEI